MKTGSALSPDALRPAIQRRVDETSLREVADEIGLKSYSALGRFLRGETSSPQRATKVLMMQWYYRRADAPASLQREELEAAKTVLRAWVDDPTLPKTVRERRWRELIESIREHGE
jgi:transcriptional regulator with XRE-family HTH domain